MARVGRPPSCECGACEKCRRRAPARAAWAALTPEQRREVVARRDKAKVREADKARYRRHRIARMALMRVQQERHPEKVKARHAVSNAIRDGRLHRGPCEVCGSEKVEAHHDNYAKPLDVRWLCKEHHLEHHAQERRAA